MEFEIKDLEIVDGDQSFNSSPISNSIERKPISETAKNLTNSIIMNELHKENEEIQNKLKLNYRRLLLFEVENNKLIEEKNKMFFEVQNFIERNQILSEKNTLLEKEILESANIHKLLNEKVEVYEKINKTQLTEIKRFSKFHTKIQNVVKPFIIQLKKQVTELKAELSHTQKINAHLTLTYKEFCKKIELDLDQKNNEITNLYTEKNSLVQTYEEQIHSFSKEIIELQSKNEASLKEIVRLKKAVEFKNYFENEVIRFKRTHEEDQKLISELSQKKSAAESKVLELEQSLSDSKSEATNCRNKASDLESNLEVTRTQFSKKIDELSVLNERLSRLEKLNNQLSLELSTKQN